jgi:hypothetical protein
MVRAISTAGLLLTLALAPRGALAAVFSAGTSDPRALGRVVILPFLDSSQAGGAGDERQDDAGQEADAALDREAALAQVEARFRMHGIEYVRRAELAAAVARLSFVPTREADRAPARLKALASALAARTVVTGIIREASADSRRRGLLGEGKAEATVQILLFDAHTQQFSQERELTATAAARTKQLPSRSPSRMAKLRARVVREATEKALAVFLKPYPLLYEEDPGETFVVYPTRHATGTSAAPTAAAPSAATPAFSSNPFLFTLTGGKKIEGKIQKLENGFYTVLTEQGKAVIAREHVLSMTEKR